MEKTNIAPIRVLSESLLRPSLFSPTPNPSLFRYDPALKIAIGGKNPVKICQYSACPRRETGYAGKKMKVCARCKHVRYCSKECQKADWAGHKMRGCKDFQYSNDSARLNRSIDISRLMHNGLPSFYIFLSPLCSADRT
ncbi:hypothetical protein FB446DRAFT_468456 [Lentinula raphanica]|nr:hypothetical protein FB446DRAFT_468456 [Lentinula raphanica]